MAQFQPSNSTRLLLTAVTAFMLHVSDHTTGFCFENVTAVVGTWQPCMIRGKATYRPEI
jgi:hypothetical protein